MDSTQYQHIPAYLHWHRKILTRLKQFIVANSFLDMPIWRERRSREVYHVHSFSSLMLYPFISMYRFGISAFHPTFCEHTWVWSWHQLSTKQFRSLQVKCFYSTIRYKNKTQRHSVKDWRLQLQRRFTVEYLPLWKCFPDIRWRLLFQAGYRAFHVGRCDQSHLWRADQSDEWKGDMGKACALYWPWLGKYSTIRIVFRMVCLARALSVRKTHVSFQLPDVPIPKRYVGRIQAEEDNIKSKVRK